MKQEFVSARFIYYEGVHASGVHFSDRRVQLYDTLDYPAYSLGAEKMRMAFRISYSLLDKISFFLNDYFCLGHEARRVSFRSVWYETKGRAGSLVQRLTSSQNWPLRGLFWLSKDLFEPEFQSVTEPDAAALNDVRNHLEHRYLQLHGEDLQAITDAPQLAYSLTTRDFEERTLRLLKLVRAALIYLSLAVHCEERRRQEAIGSGKSVLPITLRLLNR